MKLTFLLFLAFIGMSTAVAAQHDHPCGTQMGRSQWLQDFQAGHYPTNRGGDEWLVAPIYVHITGEDDGTGYTSSLIVGEAIQILNAAFEQAFIQFFLIDDYHYIANSAYHNHDDFFTGRQMMQENNVDYAINLYMCAEAAGNCGYYSPSVDALVVNDDCLDAVNQTLAHEMGHLLTLPHPFVGWEGVNYDDSEPTPQNQGGREVEKTDMSNCEFASDGFCETPPDYLSYRWSCNADGESRLTQFDPDGIPFKSPGNQIMSYSTGDCRDKFESDQIDAMCANITNVRSNILSHNRVYKPITPCKTVKLDSPANREDIQFDAGVLHWEDIPNVDYYTLRVATNINFNDPVINVQLSDSFYVLPTMELGRNYFWRVDAYAAQSPCLRESSRSIFGTDDFSQIIPIDENESIHAFISDEKLIIQSKNNVIHQANIELYDLSGRQVLQHLSPETLSRLSLNISNQPSGIYILRIWSPTFSVSAKLYK
jgi:sulfur relay (sulfurtransferase) complex TusBCD TusD component (DsrE family)